MVNSVHMMKISNVYARRNRVTLLAKTNENDICLDELKQIYNIRNYLNNDEIDDLKYKIEKLIKKKICIKSEHLPHKLKKEYTWNRRVEKIIGYLQ